MPISDSGHDTLPDPSTMPPRLLFIFLDGVGLGEAGAFNPLATLELPGFSVLAKGQAWTDQARPVDEADHVFRPIDARLGMDGLPQSGTGQVALFTGVNAAKIHGAHYGPYPPTTVRSILRQKSLFARLRRNGAGPDELCFSNAFPDLFFRRKSDEPRRITTTTMMALAAGVRLRRTHDLANGTAVAADVTNEGWIGRFGSSVPERTPAEAADILLDLAERHRFTLFEAFHTDKAGHAQDDEAARSILTALDGLLVRLAEKLDRASTLLVLSSDHGNIENLRTKSHTLNPVPLAALGKGASHLARCASLVHVAPCLMAAAHQESTPEVSSAGTPHASTG